MNGDGKQLFCGILFRAFQDWERAIMGAPTKEHREVASAFQSPVDELERFFGSEYFNICCHIAEIDPEDYLERVYEVEEKHVQGSEKTDDE